MCELHPAACKFQLVLMCHMTVTLKLGQRFTNLSSSSECWNLLPLTHLLSIISLAPCPGRIPAASVFIEDLILSEDDLGWDLEIGGLSAAVLSLRLRGAACDGCHERPSITQTLLCRPSKVLPFALYLFLNETSRAIVWNEKCLSFHLLPCQNNILKLWYQSRTVCAGYPIQSD